MKTFITFLFASFLLALPAAAAKHVVSSSGAVVTSVGGVVTTAGPAAKRTIGDHRPSAEERDTNE